MERCIECGAVIRDPVKAFPMLCRDCGREDLHMRTISSRASRNITYEFAGNSSWTDDRSAVRYLWAACIFAALVGLACYITLCL